MSPPTLSFTCPSCHARLSVPESMAGVTGPCPRCAATIQAPQPRLPGKRPPEPPRPRVTLQTESRELANRLPAIEPRRTTEDAALRPRHAGAHIRRGHPPRLRRIVLPSLIGLASAATVYGLLYRFSPTGPYQRLHEAERPPAARSSTPLAPAADPVVISNRSETPQVTIDAAEGIRAQTALEQFLATQSNDARPAYLEPETGFDELAGLLPEGPFPRVGSVLATEPFHHPIEGWNGHSFRVSFEDENGARNDCLMLVVCRPGQPPKVAARPLFDLLGGRLARFAATPGDELGTFRAVVEPMSRCFEEDVPDAGRKITYKLAASPGAPDIARAYAARNSELGLALDTPGSGIGIGTRLRATFTLGWNRSEDPDHPYLEMLEINALEWEP